MKKIKFLLLAVFAVVCFTGCGADKKLVCTQSGTESGMKNNVEVTINFSNNKASKVKMDMAYEIAAEEAKEQWDEMIGMLDGMVGGMFADKAGITFSSKEDKNNYKYTATLDMDLNKMSKDTKGLLDMDMFADEDTSYEAVKKSAEEDGFTCK